MADTYRKRMVICTPFGEYVNGDQEGEMTPERLKAIAARAKKYPRQIKAYLNGDHPDTRSQRPADGWFDMSTVEYTTSYPGYPEGALVADCAAHGELAQWLEGDLVRGASIGTVGGRNPDGSPQGEVLDHVLISDDNFDKRVNIAAVNGGGEVVAYFTTVFKKEPAMAEDKTAKLEAEVTRLTDELKAAKAQTPDEKVALKLKETETLYQEVTRENVELRASNENLKADVEKFRENPSLEIALRERDQDRRQLRAEKVRRLVKDGVAEGRFNFAMVGEAKRGYDHPNDEIVLDWFEKKSQFKGSFELLEFALASFEKKPLGRTFKSGSPKDAGEVTLTQEDREMIRKLGQDPEAVMVGMKARNFDEFQSLTKKEQ